MHDSAGGQYDEMLCEFEYEDYEDGWSVGSKFSFVRGDISHSELLDDPGGTTNDLVRELHKKMKMHTGGDWQKLILFIDNNGKANAKFVY